MTLKALIFDVDGTLADTERYGHRVAFNLAFQDVGLDWHWHEAVYGELLGVGGGFERMEAYALFYQHDSVNEETLREAHKRKAVHFRQLVESGEVPLRPGVKRLLNEARAEGITLAVATNCSSSSLRALTTSLLDAEPHDVFDVRVTGDELDAKKPDPAAYRQALAGLQLPASACMAFEDSHIGLTAALGNDLVTLVTQNDYTAREDFTGAPLVLTELGEPNSPCATEFDQLGIGPVSYFDIEVARRLHAAAT